MKNDYLFPHILNRCLVFDIETSAFDEVGREINLFVNFDRYVERAEVKWFGAYSYKHEKYFVYTHNDTYKIIDLMSEHSVLIGFN